MMNQLIISDNMDSHSGQKSRENFPKEFTDASSDWQIEWIYSRLGKLIELLVVNSMSAEVSELTTSEYFVRVAKFRMKYINSGNYNNSLSRIVDELLIECQDKHQSDTWYFNGGGIGKHYEKQIIETANELAEYRTLQRIRSTLAITDLIAYLEPMLLSEVSRHATFKYSLAMDDLKAELYICLTDIEKKNFLEQEYKKRLSAYRQKAQGTIIRQYIGEPNPIRWFSNGNQEETCLVLLDNYVWFNELDNIELDLSLSKVFHGTDDKIKWDTGELIAEWQVIELLRKKLVVSTEDPITLASEETNGVGQHVTQAQLALFYYYCHEKGCQPAFSAGKIEQAYKAATAPYQLAWKPFQQYYNRFKDRRERMSESNRKALLAAMQMLEEYPEALELAKDELKTAETRNPLT